MTMLLYVFPSLPLRRHAVATCDHKLTPMNFRSVPIGLYPLLVQVLKMSFLVIIIRDNRVVIPENVRMQFPNAVQQNESAASTVL